MGKAIYATNLFLTPFLDPEVGRFLSPDPYVQDPEHSQNFNRYAYVLNNPLSYTDPSGHFFKKLFKGIKRVFKSIGRAIKKVGKWIKENWRVLVTAALALVTGGVAGSLAAGAGWGAAATATIAGVAAGFVGGFASGILNGANFGDALLQGLKGGIIGGVMAYIQYSTLDRLYKYTHAAKDKEMVFYKVTDAKNLKAVKIENLSYLDGKKVDLFENGILNDRSGAISLGAHYTGKNSFILAHNPTKGFLADMLESSLGKMGFQTPVSRQLAGVLKRIAPDSTIYAHSQGTIIARNALMIARSQGADVSGFTTIFDGAAVNKVLKWSQKTEPEVY